MISSSKPLLPFRVTAISRLQQRSLVQLMQKKLNIEDLRQGDHVPQISRVAANGSLYHTLPPFKGSSSWIFHATIPIEEPRAFLVVVQTRLVRSPILGCAEIIEAHELDSLQEVPGHDLIVGVLEKLFAGSHAVCAVEGFSVLCVSETLPVIPLTCIASKIILGDLRDGDDFVDLRIVKVIGRRYSVHRVGVNAGVCIIVSCGLPDVVRIVGPNTVLLAVGPID